MLLVFAQGLHTDTLSTGMILPFKSYHIAARRQLYPSRINGSIRIVNTGNKDAPRIPL